MGPVGTRTKFGMCALGTPGSMIPGLQTYFDRVIEARLEVPDYVASTVQSITTQYREADKTRGCKNN